MAVSGNRLQDVNRDDGISPWVTRIVELDSIGEFAKEWRFQATNCKTSVAAMGFSLGWRGL
jgi:hypothetical protein